MSRTLTSLLVGVTLLVALTACVGGEESGEHNEGAGDRRAQPERRRRPSIRKDPALMRMGEESGTQYGLTEKYDVVRAGARLILSYDASSNAFMGTVENTAQDTLRRVRVEVHLSNGIELGPTTPRDLTPGQVTDITLPASNGPFESWSAHPEVG